MTGQPIFLMTDPPKVELHVEVIEAENLPKMDVIGKCDGFCLLQLSSSQQVYRTAVCKNTYTPVWNQTFRLSVDNPSVDVLYLRLKDADVISDDDPISNLKIPLKGLAIGAVIDEWYEPVPVSGVKKGGRLHLKLQIAPAGREPFTPYEPPAESPTVAPRPQYQTAQPQVPKPAPVPLASTFGSSSSIPQQPNYGAADPSQQPNPHPTDYPGYQHPNQYPNPPGYQANQPPNPYPGAQFQHPSFPSMGSIPPQPYPGHPQPGYPPPGYPPQPGYGPPPGYPPPGYPPLGPPHPSAGPWPPGYLPHGQPPPPGVHGQPPPGYGQAPGSRHSYMPHDNRGWPPG